MTKEEQLSFWAETSKTIERLVNTLNEFAREQKSAESRRASAYVTPEEESAMPAAFVHKCSYCRYSFYVKGPVPRSSYGVTCPECGNIDTYEPFDENMEFVPWQWR